MIQTMTVRGRGFIERANFSSGCLNNDIHRNNPSDMNSVSLMVAIALFKFQKLGTPSSNSNCWTLAYILVSQHFDPQGYKILYVRALRKWTKCFDCQFTLAWLDNSGAAIQNLIEKYCIVINNKYFLSCRWRNIWETMGFRSSDWAWGNNQMENSSIMLNYKCCLPLIIIAFKTKTLFISLFLFGW